MFCQRGGRPRPRPRTPEGAAVIIITSQMREGQKIVREEGTSTGVGEGDKWDIITDQGNNTFESDLAFCHHLQRF